MDWAELVRLKGCDKPESLTPLTDEDITWVNNQYNSVTFDKSDNLLDAVEQIKKEASTMKKRLDGKEALNMEPDEIK